MISELNKWINWLVKEFNFDGIRMDTVRHVRQGFWDAFTQSSGVFSIGEVADGNPSFVGSYQGSHMDSTLGFPLFHKLQILYSDTIIIYIYIFIYFRHSDNISRNRT